MNDENSKDGLTTNDLIGVALICATVIALAWIFFG